MRQIYKHVLIFSTYQSNESDDVNSRNHAGLCNILRLHKIPFKVFTGFYKGAPEMSIMVGVDQIAMVQGMCSRFNQECYLERFSDNSCQLVYPDGTRADIGQMRQVSKAQAVKHDAYTFNPRNDSYWVAV